MKKTEFYKYHGTGNDFIMIDNRHDSPIMFSHDLVARMCHRRFGIGADGLILLEKSVNYDFRMKYFNSDGHEGSMCGNGGRCAVAFAAHLGIISDTTAFEAIDGIHEATILRNNGHDQVVSLRMNDVNFIERHGAGYVLNTGSPHYVEITDDVRNLNVITEGRRIRNSESFVKEGINVNFVSCNNDINHLRTYERGVEDETWSCGTGSVAAAIVLSLANKVNESEHVSLNTPGGKLQISFHREGDTYREIKLTGGAVLVFKGLIDLI